MEELLEREHFPHFLQSEFNAKHQVDILTGGQVSLIRVTAKNTHLFSTIHKVNCQHCLRGDPGQCCGLDLDLAFHFDADPDSPFHLEADADPDPAFHF